MNASDEQPDRPSAEIVDLDVVTLLDTPPEKILGKAQKADLQAAIVIGWNKDDEFYFASTYADGPEALWLLEVAKLRLLKIGSGEDV